MRTELRRDYTALFTHPERPLVAICEMRFRDGRDRAETPSTPFLNEAALHAESCYRAAGLSLDGSRSREPGDHLAIELEFMAYLNARLAEALQRMRALGVRHGVPLARPDRGGLHGTVSQGPRIAAGPALPLRPPPGRRRGSLTGEPHLRVVA